MNKNLVKYGICKVHVHPITAIDNSKTDGTGYTYAAAFELPGARSINLPNNFASQIVWADNRKYKVLKKNHGYNGSLDVVDLVEQFYTDIVGEVNGVENADARIKDFGLSFEFDGDENAARVFLYHCALTQKPGVMHNTVTENLDPDMDTVNIEVLPRSDTNDIKIKNYPGEPYYDTMLSTPPNPVEAREGESSQQSGETQGE